jgi:hypothetical protein
VSEIYSVTLPVGIKANDGMRRGEQLIYAFYALGALALASISAEWKRARAALALTIITLTLAAVTLAIASYIAYAGGHIRHREFRFEPAPEPAHRRASTPRVTRGKLRRPAEEKDIVSQQGDRGRPEDARYSFLGRAQESPILKIRLSSNLQLS